MHSAHRPNDILASCPRPLLGLPICFCQLIQKFGRCEMRSFKSQKVIVSRQRIGLHISTVLLSLLPGNSNKHTSMPANYSFTLCDSRQSSPVLLASHQSLLMCSHEGNQHANLMEVYEHRQRITGRIVITSLPLGINIKSIKL